MASCCFFYERFAEEQRDVNATYLLIQHISSKLPLVLACAPFYRNSCMFMLVLCKSFTQGIVKNHHRHPRHRTRFLCKKKLKFFPRISKFLFSRILKNDIFFDKQGSFFLPLGMGKCYILYSHRLHFIVHLPLC